MQGHLGGAGKTSKADQAGAAAKVSTMASDGPSPTESGSAGPVKISDGGQVSECRPVAARFFSQRRGPS